MIFAEERLVMEPIVQILQHPITAIGVAGFIVLQAVQLTRWVTQQADVNWWRVWVAESAEVYLRATGKGLDELDAADIEQIAAAAGCTNAVAAVCLRDLRRRMPSLADGSARRR
jgi:hypothetical protein